MSFYEKICEHRQELLITDAPSKLWKDKMQVLSELMSAAFCNWQTPDELPKIFSIRNIEFMNSEQIKCFLLDCLHINVWSVMLDGADMDKGKTFRIELS